MINTNLSFILRFFSNVPAESQEQVVMHAFSSLPVEVRTALLIKSIDGLQHNEAAEALTEMMAIMTATEAAEPAAEASAAAATEEAAAADAATDTAVEATGASAKAARDFIDDLFADDNAAESAVEEADSAAEESAVEAENSADDNENYTWSSADDDDYLGYDPVADLSYAVRRVDTVRECKTRREVLLDTEELEYGIATFMFRYMPQYEYRDILDKSDFLDGCTIENTPAELLGDEVLDLDPDRFPQPKYATNARYFEMMRRVRRLIESHRCMLFEQVSKLSDYAMDDELFEAIKESLRSPYDRSEFLQKTRHQQLHYIASQWADQAKAIKAERRWHESDW